MILFLIPNNTRNLKKFYYPIFKQNGKTSHQQTKITLPSLPLPPPPTKHICGRENAWASGDFTWSRP